MMVKKRSFQGMLSQIKKNGKKIHSIVESPKRGIFKGAIFTVGLLKLFSYNLKITMSYSKPETFR